MPFRLGEECRVVSDSTTDWVAERRVFLRHARAHGAAFGDAEPTTKINGDDGADDEKEKCRPLVCCTYLRLSIPAFAVVTR